MYQKLVLSLISSLDFSLVQVSSICIEVCQINNGLNCCLGMDKVDILIIIAENLITWIRDLSADSWFCKLLKFWL